MTARPASRWFAVPEPRPHAAMRLFCFPYAGAGASVYYRWGTALPEWLECVAIKLPGREERIRERPAAGVEELIAPLVAEIAPLLDRPFAFYGHSMGALIAYELALALGAAGARRPAAVIVGAYPAPGSAAGMTPETPVDVGRSIAALSDAQLLDEVRSYHWEPEGPGGQEGKPRRAAEGAGGAMWDHPELLEFLLPILRADFTLCDRHRRGPEPALPDGLRGGVLDCPLLVFGGSGDAKVPASRLEAWRGLTRGAFHRETIPGGHLFLNTCTGPLIDRMSVVLKRLISR